MRTEAEAIIANHEAKLREVEVDILDARLLANKTEAEYWKVRLQRLLEDKTHE